MTIISEALERILLKQGRYPDCIGTVSKCHIMKTANGKDLPLVDGWDGEIQYGSDGKHYYLVSAGSDGAQEHKYAKLIRDENGIAGIAMLCKGSLRSKGRDWILIDGMFRQWEEEDTGVSKE